jgi:RNA 3'-terminal phosphate cyclase (ATP)
METRPMIKPELSIDGSQGEGGGQIVRTSLALSMLTGRAVEITNLRAGREKPGLMRQHLTAVRAAVEVSGAEVIGDEVGSRCIQFAPQAVQPGDYVFAVGTAGSATLVLQTVLPALLVASGESQLTLEGGTHNPWAPPFDFLAHTYLPLVNRMGPQVTATLDRYGFYPAGGGRFNIAIRPTPKLQVFNLLERGELRSRRATGIVAKLPAQIAERELSVFADKLQWLPDELHVIEVEDSAGPGNVVMLCVEFEHVAETFIGFGQVGVRAENVAGEVLKQYRNYQTSGAPVGAYLADQLLLPLGIAAWQTGRGGSFRTSGLSRHASTHIDLLRQFLEIPISVVRDAAGCLVSVGQ